MPADPPLDIQPVADDGLGALRVGMVLWALAGVVLVIRRDDLAAQGNEWWLLTCMAALLVGLLNWVFFSIRVANRNAREASPGGSLGAERSG